MDSKFPNQLDDNTTLPAVNNNITEVGGDAINGLRSAVFNIEEALGLLPNGTEQDVSTRLSTSLNSDGSLKSSAISSVGLVSLPISNVQIDSSAEIEESKLNLDYNTTELKTWIDELSVFISSLYDNLLDYINKFNKHIAHPSLYGRHYTLDVDGYVGKYTTFNLQGVVSDLDERIDAHVNDVSGAHGASSISVDDSNLQFNSNDVQEAIEELDKLNLNNVIYHRNYHHSNGILTQQDVVLPNESHNVIVIDSSEIAPFSTGTNHVRYSIIPVNLGQASKGDRIKIESGSNNYEYNILQIDYVNGTILFDGTIPVSSNDAFVTIYASTEEKTSSTVLKAVIRQKSISETAGGSVIQLLHPNAPFIIGSSFSPTLLNDGTSYINIAWDGGTTGDVPLYYYLDYLFTTRSSWTPENVAYAINQAFRDVSNDNWFPIVAFDYNGRVGFAFNEPSGFIQIGASSSSSTISALGLVVGEKKYAIENRRLYISGNEYFGIKKTLDAIGETDDTTQIINIDDDLYVSGVMETGLVRISNHPSINGTFVFNSISSDSISIDELPTGFPLATGVGVKIYSDTFSAAPDKRTLYELFVDGYAHPYVEFNGSPRVEYYNTSGYSSHNPETWFDVISVSDTFAKSEKRIKYTSGSLQFGDRSSGGLIINAGNTVVLPTSNVEGFRFRLYDGSYVNYIDIEVSGSGYTAPGVINESIDVDVYDKTNMEQYLLIATVLHDRSEFRQLVDIRQFGTISEKDIGTDFKRDYISYPNSLLRSSGVIFGFSTIIGGSSTSFTLLGGQAFVNGTLFYINMQDFQVPSDGVTSIYNLFIDEMGICKFLKDNYFESGKLTTPSIREIVSDNSKLIIAQIYVNSSNHITVINDFRKFVGKLDNKVELFVEENDITNGSFASLFAAINYLNAQASDYPGSKILKIRGTVYHDVSDGLLYLPSGVTISGDGEASNIVLQQTGSIVTKFCVLGGNCKIEKVLFTSETITLESLFVDFDGSVQTDASGLHIDQCMFRSITTNLIVRLYGQSANIRVEKCKFELPGMSAMTSAGLRAILTSSVGITNFCFENNLVSSTGIVGGIAITVGSEIRINNNSFITNGIAGTFFACSEINNSFIINNIILSSGELYIGDYTIFTPASIFHVNDKISDTFILNNSIKITASTEIETNDLITLGYNSTQIENVYVCNNVVETSNTSRNIIVTGGGGTDDFVTNLVIGGNNFILNKVTDKVVYIRNNSSEIFNNIKIINNNIIANYINYGFSFVGSAGISNLVIDGNSVINNYQTSLIGSCVYIYTTGNSDGIKFCNNVIKNSNTQKGFENAILFASNSGDNINLNIELNLFYNFNAVSSVIIVTSVVSGMNLFSDSFIKENVFIECSSIVKSYILLTNVKITDNIINNNTTGSAGALFDFVAVSDVDICNSSVYSKMSHVGFVKISNFYTLRTVSNLNISNNNFKSTSLIDEIIYISSSNCNNCKINNNNIDAITNTCIHVVSYGDIENVNVSDNVISGYMYASSITITSGPANHVSYVYINKNIVCNGSLNAASGDCVNVYSTGTGTDYNINNNVFVNSGSPTKGFLNAVVLENADYVNINNNILKYFGTINSHGIYLTDVSYCQINSNILYNVLNSISITETDNVFINNNMISNITSGNSYLINITNSSKNTYVENNMLRSEASSTAIINCDSVVSNAYISGNDIICTGTSSPTYIIKYANAGESITNINLCYNNINIANCLTSCMYMQGGASITNLNILGNNIVGSSLTASVIYFDTDAVIYNVVVSNNNIISNESTAVGNNYMFFIDGDLRLLNVSNNILSNFSSTKGVKNGIKINNANDIVVSGNILNNFNYMSSTSSSRAKSMILNNIVNFIVSDNNITSCANGLGFLGDVSDGIISNNIIESKSGYCAVYYDGISTQTNMSFVGNIFKNIYTNMTNHLMMLNSGSLINICNNLFYSSFSTASAYRLLVLYSYNNYICNNTFVGSADFTYSPVHIFSDGTTVCAFNNFRGCTLVSGTVMAHLDLGGGTNYCNFGETYTVTLPLSKVTVPYFTSSSWKTIQDSVTNDYVFKTMKAFFISGIQALQISFGTEVVPSGSEITGIGIAYNFSENDVDGIKVIWKRKTSLSSSEAIVSVYEYFSYFPSTAIKYIYPDSTPLLMGSGDVHNIYVENVDAGGATWIFSAVGFNVTYKL